MGTLLSGGCTYVGIVAPGDEKKTLNSSGTGVTINCSLPGLVAEC